MPADRNNPADNIRENLDLFSIAKSGEKLSKQIRKHYQGALQKNKLIRSGSCHCPLATNVVDYWADRYRK